METKTIYIIRHGEKSDDEKNLTKKGKRQSECLADRLKKLNITKIYSSDLQRCKETAEIIQKKLRLPINYKKALREVPRRIKEQPKRNKKEIKILRNFWNKIDKSRRNLLLVSSGIVNRILISFALNIDSPKANFMQYPTGLTKIEKIKKNRYRIGYINDTSHLPNKLKMIQN